MNKKRLFAALCLACCFVRVGGQAQTLRREEIATAVMKISALIKSNYVFERQAEKIASHLLQEHRKGVFHQMKDWTEFAAACTKILQDFSKDGHLYVRRDAKTVKELSTPANQPAESSAEDQFFHGGEARERNFGFDEVKVLKGNIGYLKLSQINISEKSLPTLFAAMEFVSRTKALILDLRNNGGGGSEIGAILESFFLPKNTSLLEFRNRTGQTNTEKTVPWLIQRKYDKPLFIVVNKKTASAAEAIAFGLQAARRAVVVGQTSSGAAHMNSWYVVNDEVFVSVSTGAPTLPGTDRSWEGRGVQPDVATAEGDEVESILRKIK